MNEDELIKFVYGQGLSYEFSYIYTTLNSENVCCIVATMYPWFSSKVVYFPCKARDHRVVFKLQDKT